MKIEVLEAIYRKNSIAIVENKEKLRAKLEKDKELFFKNGGQIEICPIYKHNGRNSNTNFKISESPLDQTIKHAQLLGRLNHGGSY